MLAQLAVSAAMAISALEIDLRPKAKNRVVRATSFSLRSWESA